MATPLGARLATGREMERRAARTLDADLAVVRAAGDANRETARAEAAARKRQRSARRAESTLTADDLVDVRVVLHDTYGWLAVIKVNRTTVDTTHAGSPLRVPLNRIVEVRR